MYKITVATAALAVWAGSALAQAPAGMKTQPAAPPKQDDRPKVDDKAYKSALDRIPTAEQVDPWSGVRPADSPATAKKKKK